MQLLQNTYSFKERRKMHIAKHERVKRAKCWEVCFWGGGFLTSVSNRVDVSDVDTPTGLWPFGYGMHTSFGGRWCHRSTCRPHSHPLSAAQIYLHSLLFSRDPSCERWCTATFCLFVVPGARDCWQDNIYSLKDRV